VNPSAKPAARTIDVAPLSFRAEFAPSSINVDERTVDLTFTKGAAVERRDWFTGDRYIEKLSMDPKHVRLDRLNSGAPLLDTHSGWSVRDMLGAVVRGTAEMKAREGRATVKFSSRPDVEPVFRDVRDGVITNVSVGYRVYAFEEVAGKGDKLPVRTAVDWEPYEISMVPMPADIGAQTRDGKTPELQPNQAVITVRVADQPPIEERTMDPNQSETIVEQPQVVADPTRAVDNTADQPNDLDRGQNIERERIAGIMAACRAARMGSSFMDKLINEGTPLLRAQALVFEEMQKRGGDQQGPKNTATPDIRLGDDPMVHERRGIENALLHRVSPQRFNLEDIGRKYRGLSLLETAKLFLNARGQRTTDMSKNQIAAAALGLDQRVGYHTTSDFPLLLADVASKSLRREYELAPQTFTLFGRRVTLPDYKPSNRLDLGEAPALLEVKEHGEYTHGTIGEGREQMQLVKYGRKFAITREALINDDTDAFSRVPQKFGRAARNLESNLAWLQILSNPVMGDGNALFSVAHNNLGNGTVINIASVGAGRAAMRLQTGRDSDGQTFINASPRYLIVPPSLETVADQFVTPIIPGVNSDANPIGARLMVISEPRLETGIGAVAGSAIAWYLAASAEQGIDILEYGYLDGEEGPQIESRVGFDIDGLEIKCRLDFAAKVIDWKGIYKDPGELVS
jgi:hypothetical protein